MKQKITKGKLVTEDRLEEILDKKLDERFLQQDKKLDERFLQQDKKLDERFAQQDKKFDERFVQQDEKMRLYKDELLNALVDIVAQLDDTRVDRDLAVGQTRELAVRVDNHEKRLQILEKH